MKVWRYNGPASNAEPEASPYDHCRCLLSPTRHLRPHLENPAPLLPGGPGKVGRPAQDNRRFSNAVFRVLRTGAPWRDLPPDYGHWNTPHNRFRRWQKNGAGAQLLATLAGDSDLEWLMIDGNYVKAHQHGTGAVGGNQAVGRTKELAPYPRRGGSTKIHLAVAAHGMTVRLLATAGTVADCTQAATLIEGIPAEYLLAGGSGL